jgi:predicted amidophosphoribosyltransferase
MLGLLLPQRCVGCGRAGVQLCEACFARVPLLTGPLCRRCGAPTAWPVERCAECAGRRISFATARAAAPYDDPVVRALVTAWKERGLRRLVREAVCLVTEVVPRPEGEMLVPVPADRGRTLRRGHHPAAGLADSLAAAWEIPSGAALTVQGRRRRQRGLSPAERRRNAAGAYAAGARQPARVVLVDDVYTTGATASAAALALRRAGARRVDVVTFARAVRGPAWGEQRLPGTG